MKNQKEQTTAQPLFYLFLIVAFIFLCYKCSCSDDENNNSQQTELSESDLELDAYIDSQVSVKNSLKSPSTAEFPFGGYSVVKMDENVYVVNSYVDSQNGFGAMLRTRYSCKITLFGNDDYTCEDLMFYN